MMDKLFFDLICFGLICLCFWRITEIKHRLEMNIIVTQSLQERIKELENK